MRKLKNIEKAIGVVFGQSERIDTLEAENARLREAVTAALESSSSRDGSPCKCGACEKGRAALSAPASGWLAEKLAAADKAGFDRGWRGCKGEIAAALGSDWRGIYLKTGDLWAVKVDQLLAAARREGAEQAVQEARLLLKAAREGSVPARPPEPPCWICHKPKGQGPDRCAGHYDVPDAAREGGGK